MSAADAIEWVQTREWGWLPLKVSALPPGGLRVRVVRRLSEAQNHRCAYCGVPMRIPGEYCRDHYSRLSHFADRRSLQRFDTNRYATFDHVLPISAGGGDDVDNVVIACRWCNTFRGNAPVEVALEAIGTLLADGRHPMIRAMQTGRFVDVPYLPTFRWSEGKAA